MCSEFQLNQIVLYKGTSYIVEDILSPKNDNGCFSYDLREVDGDGMLLDVKESDIIFYNSKNKRSKMNNNKYYIVVTEWLYPTESGREAMSDWDSFADALKECEDLVFKEIRNYWEATCCDPTPISLNSTKDGYLITDNKGLEDWWFQAKIIEVKYGI